VENDLSVRIDKWLWASRFFKTRSLAARAVNGGKVSVNDARVKASRGIKIGDTLHIIKGQMEFTVNVLQIVQYRRSASEASKMYSESTESIDARLEKIQMLKNVNAGHTRPAGKPGKRDRRKIREFTRKE
jgi:ribosome-associated heat shock protein Hsp15